MIAYKKILKKLLRTAGFDIIRFHPKTHPIARRMMLIENYGINHVLDVGANRGQYAAGLREYGYSGKISSFEPVSASYQLLEKNSGYDNLWDIYKYGLGEENKKTKINIANNSYSSSLLNMLPIHESAAPESRYVAEEEIEIRTLDSIYQTLADAGNNIYLKIDTQGYEEKVLVGAKESIKSIDTLQLEMSLQQLYDSELLFFDMHNMLSGLGYTLVSMEPGFTDKISGQLLQVDGIYHRFT